MHHGYDSCWSPAGYGGARGEHCVRDPKRISVVDVYLMDTVKASDAGYRVMPTPVEEEEVRPEMLIAGLRVGDRVEVAGQVIELDVPNLPRRLHRLELPLVLLHELPRGLGRRESRDRLPSKFAGWGGVCGIAACAEPGEGDQGQTE